MRAHHLGDGFEIVGDAGGGFIVSDEDGFDLLAGVGREALLDLLGIGGRAVVEGERLDLGAVGLGDAGVAVAEDADADGQHFVAGGKQVDHRGLEAAGAGGGEDVDVLPRSDRRTSDPRCIP